MSHQCVNAYIANIYAGAPFYVSNGGLADNATSSNPVNVAYPGNLFADDIAFLQAVIYDSLSANTVNTPSGWTLVSQDTLDGATNLNHALFWKRLTGAESGTVNITTSAGHGGTDTLAGVISIWRGCIPTGTPYEALANNTGTSTSLTGSSVTTLGPRRMVVNFGACGNFGSTPATNWTEQYDLLTASGTPEAGLKAYSIEELLPITLAGAVHTISSSSQWQAKSLALIKSGADISSIHTRVPAGDMQSGSDRRIPAGDMQSGSDLRKAEEIT